jgi:hypothetical protein
MVLWIIACLGAMIAFFGPTDNWNWDPSFYYAQLRSPIIDHDLDFRGETVPSGVLLTPTGLQGSVWPVGPSVLWAPFFLLAHLGALLVSPAEATGWSFPYVALVAFGSALYGAIGLAILYRTCRHFGGRFMSAVAALLCLGATPLFYYIFRQPMMAHTAGFLVSAVQFLLYVRLTEGRLPRDQSGVMFGLLLGLSFLTRWSGLLFAILPAAYFAGQVAKTVRGKNSSELRFLARQTLVLAACFALTISPQLAFWCRLYGRLLVSPQGAESFVASAVPQNVLKVLLHTNRGLLFWSPFLLLGMLGLARIRNRQIRMSAMLLVILQVVLLGYRVDWYGGGGYGPRYFIETLPILAVGFTCLGQGIAETPAGKAVLATCGAVLVAHQAALVYAVEQGWVGSNYFTGQPLGVGWQLTTVRRLVEHPGLWLMPRPFVAQGRQTILVNYAAGVRDIRAYLIPGIAAALTPIVVVVSAIVWRRRRRLRLPVILVGVVAYMVAWSFYLMLVN